MSFSQGDHRSKPLKEALVKGSLIGIAGGLAEIVFIFGYMTAAGRDPAIIAGGVAEAVGLGSGAMTGVVVHMALAVLLGIGATAVWLAVRNRRPQASTAYLFMSVALVAVWSFNFLVLLPVLSPAFLALLPYPVTFASKMLFALAGAPVLHRLAGADRAAYAHTR